MGATSGNSGPTANWQIATVSSVSIASPRVKLFELELPTGMAQTGFHSGQYFDIRLTAPDGYQAQRSYSVSSSPHDSSSIELTIELIEDGEVSSYFHEAVEPGEKIEIRGPIGGHFTWNPSFPRPILMIAGGSGLAPIMSMIRHRKQSQTGSPALLLFSVRNEVDILFREELEQLSSDDPSFNSIITLTRAAPEKWDGESRRIDRSMIDNAISNLGLAPGDMPGRAYICGGSDFVESIGNYLVETGMKLASIRTERFGP
jgi:ferredoxin-NADP reductase